jgi:hypothetical protein
VQNKFSIVIPLMMRYLLQQQRKGKIRKHPTKQLIAMCGRFKATNHTNQIGGMMKFWHLSKPKRKST